MHFLAYFVSLSLIGLLYFTMPAQAVSSKAKDASKLSLSDVLSILGSGLGLVTLGIGVYQYSAAQKWKRAEFVASQIKEFESDKDIKNVLLMLDWNSRKIQFSDEECIQVTDELLSSALVPHTWNNNSSFSDAEALIRDSFDKFLNKLDRFEAFIEAGLVTKEDVQPYLNYWLNILGNAESERKPLIFYKNLWSYIDYYQYSKTQKLLSRYGYSINPSALDSSNIKFINSKDSYT
jgi:hypothetical protein